MYLLLLFIPSLSCLIHRIEMQNDTRSGFFINRFGLEEGGQILLEIQEFKVTFDSHVKSNTDKRQAVLVRSTLKDDSNYLIEGPALERTCPLTRLQSKKEGERNYVYFINARTQKINHTVHFPGYHHLFFINCPQDSLSLKMVLTEFNLYEDGRRNYLSLGDSMFPLIYLVFALTNFFATIIWIAILLKNRSLLNMVHVLMTVLIVLKVLSLFSRSVENYFLKVSGVAEGWSVSFYIFSISKTIMTFIVIGLIGAGYNFFKFYLSDQDRRIFSVIIALQIFANIAQFWSWEGSLGSNWSRVWGITFRVVDIICCCAILVHISMTRGHLLQAAETDGKAARIVKQLTLFRHFYVLVTGYLYMTRVLVFFLDLALPFGLEWFSFVFNELVTFFFYLVIGFKFRPMEDSPFFKLHEEDQECTDEISCDFIEESVMRRASNGGVGLEPSGIMWVAR
eukprot:TRINITY_DN6656_c0_g4_i2.p1 TRINITY_DN6656_c0_g4~~TRINITY_DN6656_c0_g4_i2.p1  ORF type:complete len:452 (-),score=59.75 TRINITY_DN6656_c0_g4_i2:121-1476(-)